jgi:hypothetical protein
MSIYIELFHGHHSPDEQIEDWGFDGPILGPFPYFHITYGSDVKLGDDPILVAGQEYVFPTWDKDGFINFLVGYYGDMSITNSNIKEYLKRHTKTKEVLSLPLNQIPKLINDTEEWVRVYANMVLKNNKVL